MNRWLVMLLGMGTVFVGLICLIILTKLMSFFITKFSRSTKTEDAEPAQTTPAVATASVPVAISDRPAFVAAIASAIATCIGTDVSGLRICSIRRTGENDERPRFTAAVAASIASVMGADVHGLRIKSIKKI